MSNQDPPFGNPSDRPLGSSSSFDQSAKNEADKLRDAGNTVRNDLSSAAETAKSDFRSATETASRDFAALKDQASSQLSELKNQATSEFSNLKSQAQGQLGEATEKAKAYATEQASQLGDRARSFANEQKGIAAEQVGGFSEAVSRFAEDLQGSNSAVAGYAQNLAGSLRTLADNVQNKSVEDLFSIAQDFGRRQPLAFAGIAALAGFAASRFLIASADRSEPAPAYGRERDYSSTRDALDRDDYEVDFERDATRDTSPASGVSTHGRI